MLQLIDTHAHLDFTQFDADRAELIARTQAGGIQTLINVGASLAGSRASIALAQKYPSVFASVGVHPEESAECCAEELIELATQPKVVAIGECGLDYSQTTDPNIQERQKELFKLQLAVAEKLQLPVIIHSRNSFTETLDILKQHEVRAVFHCWSYSPVEARMVIDGGYSLSFTAIVTYPKALSVQETAASVPAGRFWLETDSPLLPPQSQRGKRNEPLNVFETAQKIADLRQISLEELAQQTTAAANHFFGFWQATPVTVIEKP